mmetsp:Transcript_66098/g.149207  ORF Transcript_66098/g.149207 Transcript_66098/m.149207 type:complete len:220 (+) Transcript_66098:905-1564(+)
MAGRRLRGGGPHGPEDGGGQGAAAERRRPPRGHGGSQERLEYDLQRNRAQVLQGGIRQKGWATRRQYRGPFGCGDGLPDGVRVQPGGRGDERRSRRGRGWVGGLQGLLLRAPRLGALPRPGGRGAAQDPEGDRPPGRGIPARRGDGVEHRPRRASTGVRARGRLRAGAHRPPRDLHPCPELPPLGRRPAAGAPRQGQRAGRLRSTHPRGSGGKRNTRPF